MTSYVGYNGLEVVLSEPMGPKISAIGQEVAIKPRSGVRVGFAVVEIITKLVPPQAEARVTATATEVMIAAPRSEARVTGIATEVMMLAPRPTVYVTNVNAEILSTGNPNAQLPWLGTEVLMSVTPAVQSNFAWMGLEFLVPAEPKVSMEWLGLEALIDIKELDDIPDYMDFGNIYDPIPGTMYISLPKTIVGLTDDTFPTLYSSDAGVMLSTDGTTFNNTIVVGDGDQVYLQTTLDNIFTKNMLIFTNSEITGETEVGIWRVAGPSETLKYDDWKYYGIDTDWIEIKVSKNRDDMIEPVYKNLNSINETVNEISAMFSSMISRGTSLAPLGNWYSFALMKHSDAPLSIFKTSTMTGSSAASTGDFVSNSPQGTAFASIPDFINDADEITSPDMLENFMYQDSVINKEIPLYHTYWYFDAKISVSGKPEEGMLMPPLNPRYYSIREKFIDFERENYNEYTIFDKFIDANRGSYVGYYFVDKFIDLDRPSYLPIGTSAEVWEHISNRITIFPNWLMNKYIEFVSGQDRVWNDFSNKSSLNFDTVSVYSKRISSNSEVSMTNEYLKATRDNLAAALYTYKFAVSNILVNMTPIYYSDKLFKSTNYVRQGGYPTAELAANAAEVYGSYDTSVYMQPEGTFSFIVHHNTDLWCIAGGGETGLYAKAWLLGGG